MVFAKLFNKKYQQSFAPDVSKLWIPSDPNCDDTDEIPGTKLRIPSDPNYEDTDGIPGGVKRLGLSYA